MTMEEIIAAANKQYEEIDSKKKQKEEQFSKEDEEILEKRKQKAREDVKREADFLKNYNSGQSAAFKQSTSSSNSSDRSKKESSKSSSSSNSSSGYNSYYSSSRNSSQKTSFFEGLDKELSEQIDKMFESMAKKHMNTDDDDCWDMLDRQMEFNRKNKKKERYYQETEEDIRNKKIIKKITKKCERKIAIVEILNFFKVDLYNKSSQKKSGYYS